MLDYSSGVQKTHLYIKRRRCTYRSRHDTIVDVVLVISAAGSGHMVTLAVVVVGWTLGGIRRAVVERSHGRTCHAVVVVAERWPGGHAVAEVERYHGRSRRAVVERSLGSHAVTIVGWSCCRSNRAIMRSCGWSRRRGLSNDACTST